MLFIIIVELEDTIVKRSELTLDSFYCYIGTALKVLNEKYNFISLR